MPKKIIQFCFLLILSRDSRVNKHLDSLLSSYPFVLISDDFGILTISDLKKNSCDGDSVSYLSGIVGVYSYWQCFKVKDTYMDCELSGRDDDTNEEMAFLLIIGSRNNQIHEYMSRRDIALRSCRLYQEDWRKFTQNEKYVCISGSFPKKSVVYGKRGLSWFFDRYKTRKGCDSYFADECESGCEH